MNKVWLILLLAGGIVHSQSASASPAPRSVGDAVTQLKQTLATLAQRIDAEHPDYRTSVIAFRKHLKTCSPHTFTDPVRKVTHNIYGWQEGRCRVEATTQTPTSKRSLCLYSAADLKGSRLGAQTPFIHSSCRTVTWISGS